MSDDGSIWVGRSDMAEYAEALGIPTDQVGSVMERLGQVFVIFTPDHIEEDVIPPIYVAVMARDQMGILEVLATQEFPEFSATLEEMADAARPPFD